MTIDLQLALWAIGVIFVAGAMYGDLRGKIKRLEKALGTDGETPFMTRREFEAIHERGCQFGIENAERFEARIDAIERRR